MTGHETVAEMLAAWDTGETIWSIEMGGLGPGYEQALQIAAVELTRALEASGMEKPDLKADNAQDQARPVLAYMDGELHRIDSAMRLGLSGAQAGAAKGIAIRWWVFGPAGAAALAVEQGVADRLIQVSRAWPGAPALTKE